MNNSIWGKSPFQIFQRGYGSPKTLGNRKEKTEGIMGNNVKIDNGKNMVKNHELMGVDEPKDRYTRILNEYQLPVREDTLGILKTLDIHGIQLTKDNILSFLTANEQLEKLLEGLDYDTALNLLSKDMDLENASIQELIKAMEEVKEEKKDFSFLKIFRRNKELSTEEAEKIAYKLYGNKGGKDITDAIKSLYRAGINITRKQVDELHHLFSKLHNLEDIKEEHWVNSLKSKMEASIDSLYKVKNAITKGIVGAEEKISHLASKVYERFTAQPTQVSDRDLGRMEEDIKDLLKKIDVEPTKENVERAKEFIRQGVEVTKENIERVEELKEALNYVQEKMDYEKAAHLLKADIDIDKENLQSLMQKLEQLEKVMEKETVSFDEIGEKKIKAILDKVSHMKELDEKDLLALIKEGTNVSLKDIGKLLPSWKNFTYFKEENNFTNQIYNDTFQLVGTLDKLKDVSFNTVAFHLNNRLPLTLEGLALSQQLLQGQPNELGNTGLNYPRMITSQDVTRAEEFISQNLQSFNGMRTSLLEASKALMGNHILLNSNNLQRLYGIKNQVEYVRNHLTLNTVTEGIRDHLSLDKMDLRELVNYTEKTAHQFYMKQQMAANIHPLGMMGNGKDHLVAMMMKNQLPFNFKNLENMTAYLNNRDQIGHKMAKIDDILKSFPSEQMQKFSEELKASVSKLAMSMKKGGEEFQKSYEEMVDVLKAIGRKASLHDQDVGQQLNKGLKELEENMIQQARMLKEDMNFQLPILMNDQLKNLQVYVNQRRKGSRKIDPTDMAVLLNFDTNYLGNVNIFLSVFNKKVTMKIGLTSPQDQKLIEGEKKKIQGLLGSIGYELKDLSYRVDEEAHMMTMADELIEDSHMMNGFLDVRI